jgi:hypothetical protein
MAGPPDHLNVLAAIAWDIRASVEAQIRSLTSLQRCIEEYRATRSASALSEIVRHLDEVDARNTDVRATLPHAGDALAAIRAQQT